MKLRNRILPDPGEAHRKELMARKMYIIAMWRKDCKELLALLLILEQFIGNYSSTGGRLELDQMRHLVRNIRGMKRKLYKQIELLGDLQIMCSVFKS